MKHLHKTKKIVFLSLIVVFIFGCDIPSRSPSVYSSENSAKNRVFDKAMLKTTKKANLWLKILNRDPSIHLDKHISSVKQLSNISQIPDLAKSYFTVADTQGKPDLSIINSINGVLNDKLDQLFSSTAEITKDDINSYYAIVVKISNLAPVIPDLDTAGKRYADSLITLSNSMNKLIDYYHISEEYKLDNFKKAAGLHVEFLQAYSLYQKAEFVLNNTYAIFYQKVHLDELKQLEREGYLVSVAIYQSVDASSAIFEQLVAYFNTHDSLKGIDKASYKTLSIHLDNNIKILDEALQTQEIITSEGLTTNNVKHYVKELKQFAKIATITMAEPGQDPEKDETLLNDLQQKQKQITDGFNKYL